MKIEAGQRLGLDTNILLDATDESRPLHRQAQSVFHVFPSLGAHAVLGTQVLREYLVVATRPQKNNGLGLDLPDALFNLGEFRRRASVVPETVEAAELLAEWAGKFRVRGKNLHDLQLLATMHRAGVQTFLTSNPSDFPRQTGIEIITLSDLKLS